MTAVDLLIPYGNFEKDRNVHLKYHGYDDLYKYNVNSDILQNTNWRWLTDTIDYNLNNHGFRCDFDFDETFDFSNYVVFVGCSHVAGLGNQANSTVPALFESITNQPVINMGIGGASNEVIFQNIVWLLSRKHRPKNIVVCWTSLYRHLMYDKKMQPIHITVHNIHSRNDLKRFILKNYAVDYIERESFAKFEMVSCMQDMGVYAFNFFNADDYNLAKIDNMMLCNSK